MPRIYPHKAEPWTTQAELEWLDRIGACYIGAAPLSRRDWLKNYLAGAQRRTRWAELDRDQILNRACQLLLEAALEAGD